MHFSESIQMKNPLRQNVKVLVSFEVLQYCRQHQFIPSRFSHICSDICPVSIMFVTSIVFFNKPCHKETLHMWPTDFVASTTLGGEAPKFLQNYYGGTPQVR